MQRQLKWYMNRWLQCCAKNRQSVDNRFKLATGNKYKGQMRIILENRDMIKFKGFKNFDENHGWKFDSNIKSNKTQLKNTTIIKVEDMIHN